MNREYILFIILILLLILCYCVFQCTYNHTVIGNGYEIISSNDDEFYDKLNKINLKARKVKSISLYKKKIKDTCIDVNFNKKITIHKAIEIIKMFEINSPWVNNEQFHNMPWKIIFTKDDKYENGLPHTRSSNKYGHIIVLPIDLLRSEIQLIDTLFHEQLHIYQKTFSDEFIEYINKHYTKVNDIDKTMMRANPDINNIIYKNKDGKTLSCIYNSKNPSSLSDVTFTPVNKSKYEHPFEKLVYDLVKQMI
jgi:hypothetical protein